MLAPDAAPSKNSDSGHRLYTEADIAKLQQVISLKQMGFTLEEIKTLMESDEYDPKEVLRVQLERLNETIQRQEQLYGRHECQPHPDFRMGFQYSIEA
ncbi:MAG: merR, binding family protein [Cohnella sp.]|nr:merR, binding family protein [Cohnella sp.]